MYLQGDLQRVFDALYEMGVIEPLLEQDWKDAMTEMERNPSELFKIVQVVNDLQHDPDALKVKLTTFDEKSLGYLAMEVAREFADFHSRAQVH